MSPPPPSAPVPLSPSPILNSPYRAPTRHYGPDAEGHLDFATVIPGRRPFVPHHPAPASHPAPAAGSHLVNQLRRAVGQWRASGYPGTTRVSGELLRYWFADAPAARRKKLFFAQQEAVETAVWLNEVAGQSAAGGQLLAHLRAAQQLGPPLPRVAFHLAPGSGRGVVMAALVLYHYLNRRQYRQDPRFAGHFLLVAPSRASSIRLGQLRVVPVAEHGPGQDYYRQHQLVPRAAEELLEGLNDRLFIVLACELAPRPLPDKRRGRQPPSYESPGQVGQRLLADCRAGSRLLVLNDEAHGCYPPAGAPAAPAGSGARASAGAWYDGLRQLGGRYPLAAVYDFSTTGCFPPDAGSLAHAPLPWTVTDFGLTEAIESGLMKVPSLPAGAEPPLTPAVLRHLYAYLREPHPTASSALPPQAPGEPGPALPPLLLTVLDQLVAHYQAHDPDSTGPGLAPPYQRTPPVLVVLCHDAAQARQLYRHLAGYEYDAPPGRQVALGRYAVFSNYWPDKSLRPHPPTLLIDPGALEPHGQLADECRRALREVMHQLRREYNGYYPERAAESITDAGLLREAVHTVGQPGRLGAPVHCVVAVGSLPAGWRARTVTHLLNLRVPDAAHLAEQMAEQVAGPALRRRGYDWQPYDKQGARIGPGSPARTAEYRLAPEYACVVGLPLRALRPDAGPGAAGSAPTPVRALPERAHLEIRFPNLTGYRQELARPGLRLDTGAVDRFELDFATVATRPELAATFSGRLESLCLEPNETMRTNETVYQLTSNLLRGHFTDANGAPQMRSFGPLRRLVAQWYQECLTLAPRTDPAFKWLVRYWDAPAVAGHISQAIVLGLPAGACPVYPVPRPAHAHGSTRFVHGHTARPVFATTKSHVNYVAADPQSGEQRCAQVLEELPEVLCYAHSAFLDFQIPYLAAGRTGYYRPAFLARARTARGPVVHLIIGLAHPADHDQRAPRLYVEKYWLPAVNRDLPGLGLPPDEPWAFVELSGDEPHFRRQLLQKLRDLA